MQVNAYKPSDLGPLPKNWQSVKFGDVMKVRQGLQIPISERLAEPTSTSKEYITVQSINRETQDRQYVESPSQRVTCGTNDVLMTRTGNTGIVVTGVEGAFHNNFFLMDFNRKSIDTVFLVNYLRSPRVQHQILVKAGSSTIPDLNHKDFYSIEFPLPLLPEQKKIAQILSTWDQAITTTERLLENSQQRKKGLMQQLLTGKKRFFGSSSIVKSQKTRTGEIPGDWSYPKIADICSQVTNKNSDDRQLPVLSCSKHVGFVDSLSYFKKKVYSDDLRGYRVIPRGCIGFPANHIEEGSIGLQNLYDYGLVSPIYVVFRPDLKKVNVDYLYSVLKTDHYRQIFCAATNASVDRRGSLRWKEFGQIHVPLPPLAEQNQIATVLHAETLEISGLQSSLNFLKKEKKALMQQLLTGKRRVKVDAEAA